MNIGSGLRNLFKSNTTDDYRTKPRITPKTLAVGAGTAGLGMVGVGAAVGFSKGKQFGIDNFEPGETLTKHSSYFVKTGTEQYMGTCYGTTSSGERVSMSCMKVRDVGYHQPYSYEVDARKHHANRGMMIGAGLGLAGAVVMGVAAYAIHESSYA